MTDDKVEAWLEEAEEECRDDIGAFGMDYVPKLIALVRVYRKFNDAQIILYLKTHNAEACREAASVAEDKAKEIIK